MYILLRQKRSLTLLPAFRASLSALNQGQNKSPPPTQRQSRLCSTAARQKHTSATHNNLTQRIFENNRQWVARKLGQNPDFLNKLSKPQTPEFLWIGCSDSRIPVEQITGLGPGEAFVHRNIANLVCNNDLSAASVIQYAVEYLKVQHIVVCGHYGCGGVQAAMAPRDMGMLNPWLSNIRDVYRLHAAALDGIANEEDRYRRLVELNVTEQCRNVMKTAVVQQSYARERSPAIHGWVFDLNDGLLRDVGFEAREVSEDERRIFDLNG